MTKKSFDLRAHTHDQEKGPLYADIATSFSLHHEESMEDSYDSHGHYYDDVCA